jgi:glycosyltransferase involved in cell wall biosynthesis
VDDRMRVMFAITKGEVGGAQEHVRILAQGLLERGHQVALMVTPGSHLAESVTEMGGTIFDWRSISPAAAPLANLSARRELKAAVKDWKPDLLHLNSSVAGAVGSGILRQPDGATIFTCHHTAFGAGRTWKNRLLSRPVAELTFRRMDGIITVGFRDMAVISRIAKGVPVELVRNAVPASGPPISVGGLRRSAIWVARLAEPKDPLMAVSAWERVVSQVPDAMLTICGTGPLEGDLRAMVANSQASANIEIAGFVADIRPLVERASVFFLVSKVEGGISMATLEAMGQGLVPVVSDAGDAVLLSERRSGVVAGSYDPEGLASAVVDVFSDPQRYEELRESAISFARGRTVDDFVEETIAFYRRVEGCARARAA